MGNKLKKSRWGMWLGLGALLFSACGKSVSSSSGSNTNWLKPCDTAADCGTGLECWCNVCTAPCSDGAACDQPGATCRASAGLGCREHAARAALCVASCETTVDCQPFGSGLSCINAACVGSDSAAGAGGADNSDPPRKAEVSAIAVGGSQRCLVTGGDVYCWGGNLFGEAGGDPSLDERPPHLLSEVPSAVALAASERHTCALTADGDVYCWGYNASGEIGSESAAKGTCPDYVLDKGGDYPCQPTPRRVAAVSGARQIAVGDGRSCAVLDDGSVQCWGNVDNIASWVAALMAPEGLALGSSGACAIKREGIVSCAGGALEVAGLRDVKALVLASGSGDDGFACALDDAGVVHCWGDDTYGQLGAPDATGTLTDPLDDVSQIAATSHGACALTTDGSVWCWGKNSGGEAGLAPLAAPNCGPETCQATPHRVESLPKASQLAGGGSLTCAVAEDAAVWCWGASSQRTSGAPQRVPGPWEGGNQQCIAAAAGAAQAMVDASIAFKANGCRTDQDCTSVSLDLPCLRSCELIPVSKQESANVTASLQSIGRSQCDAAPEGCAPHDVTCAATTDVDACVAGVCMRVNPATSGCSDACSCLAARSAAFGVYQGDCEGPDLWVIVAMDCKSCGPGGAWLVIGNRGSKQFSGPATLSFEAENPDEAALVPPAQVLELSLAPGEVTKPIYVESQGEVTTRSRITGVGDCTPANDASNGVTFPAAQMCE